MLERKSKYNLILFVVCAGQWDKFPHRKLEDLENKGSKLCHIISILAGKEFPSVGWLVGFQLFTKSCKTR